MDKMKRTCH